jgi:hypothetical protein
MLLVSLATAILVADWYGHGVLPLSGDPTLIGYGYLLLAPILIEGCAFAASISFARAISSLAIKLTRYVGAFAFILLVGVHYAILVVWRPIIDVLLDSAMITFTVDRVGLEAFRAISEHVVKRFGELSVSPREIFFEYYDAIVPLQAVYRSAFSEDWTYYFSHARAALMSLAANSIRFIFAAVLLFSFVGRAWLGPVISITWARLVESERPVFTILFGAVGAIAATLKELVKLL